MISVYLLLDCLQNHATVLYGGTESTVAGLDNGIRG